MVYLEKEKEVLNRSLRNIAMNSHPDWLSVLSLRYRFFTPPLFLHSFGKDITINISPNTMYSVDSQNGNCCHTRWNCSRQQNMLSIVCGAWSCVGSGWGLFSLLYCIYCCHLSLEWWAHLQEELQPVQLGHCSPWDRACGMMWLVGQALPGVGCLSGALHFRALVSVRGT